MRGFLVVGLAAAVIASESLAAGKDVPALLDQARAAAVRMDHARVVEALQEALEEARKAAPLSATPFLLVTTKAPSYGAYTPRPDAVFRSDEEMLFYLEPKNLVYPQSEDGLFAPGLAIDFEVLDASGVVVARKNRFGVFRFSSRSRLQDIYVNLSVSITGAPPGRYQVRFTLSDLNSTKTTVVVQPITRT